MVPPVRSDSKTERKGHLGDVSGMVTWGRPPLRRGIISWDLQLVALLSWKPLEEAVAGGGVQEVCWPERALRWAGTTSRWVRGSLPPAQHQ